MIVFASSSSAAPLIGGIVLIVLIVAVAGPLIVLIRRRSLSDARKADGLTMEAVERMRSENVVSEEEYRLLRRIILGLDVKEAGSGKSISSSPPAEDDENTGEGTGEGPCAEKECE